MKKYVMKSVVAALVLLGSGQADAVVISALSGSTDTPQWRYLSGKNEWFSRYSSDLTATQLKSFKTASATTAAQGLKATSDKVTVTYLGTGATRNSNLFLAYAGQGAFSTSSFWKPVYDSGGTNNLYNYNPVNATNQLFETRGGCTYQQAKAGNTCLVTQIGKSREISGLTPGDNLVFGLQALPLVYDGINLPHTNYFFSGLAANNSDAKAKGWADGKIHTRLLQQQVGKNSYLVGFEDSWLGRGTTSDKDFNDMVFLFEGVSAVPEPETYLLMLTGLGVVVAGARKRRKAALAV